MRGRIQNFLAGVGLPLGLTVSLTLGLTACGVSEDEAVRLQDGQTLSIPDVPLTSCTALGCAYPGQACLEVFFEYGRSPALCLFRDVCDRLECDSGKPDFECRIFDGYPGQVKCVKRDN